MNSGRKKKKVYFQHKVYKAAQEMFGTTYVKCVMCTNHSGQCETISCQKDECERPIVVFCDSHKHPYEYTCKHCLDEWDRNESWVYGGDKATFKPIKPGNICKNCGFIATQRCSRCKLTYYCCVECQKEDWKSHSKTCKKYGLTE